MTTFANSESGSSVRTKINAAITTVDGLNSGDNLLMAAAERSKLAGIEASATGDQSNAEIETAYNAQVPAASQAEAEAGTEAAVRRLSPLRIAQAIAALAPAGGGSMNDLVDDTTPQLGGDLDLNSKSIGFIGSNNTGSLIAKGAIVRISGTANAIALADADGSGTMPGVGVVVADIADTASGFVAMLGTVSNLNTAGMTAGSALYVSATAGNFTDTAPSAGTVQQIGRVVTAHATTGSIFVELGQGGQDLGSLTSSEVTLAADLVLFGDASATPAFSAIVRTIANFIADHNLVQSSVTKALAVGYTETDFNAGTQSTGTFTPNAANGNSQYAVNGGAHTLAPPTASTSIIVHYTNNGSAGAITTSGFTKVTGDAFTTTNAHEFLCYIRRTNSKSHLHVAALQ